MEVLKKLALVLLVMTCLVLSLPFVLAGFLYIVGVIAFAIGVLVFVGVLFWLLSPDDKRKLNDGG